MLFSAGNFYSAFSNNRIESLVGAPKQTLARSFVQDRHTIFIARIRVHKEKILADAGRVDILVNNAGVTRDGLLMRMSEEDWDAVLNTNLRGAFSFTKALSRAFIKQRSGRIINIASVVGLIGNAGQCNYAASKAALIGFTKSVARELASRGITCNALAPGFIETDMTASMNEQMRAELSATPPRAAFEPPR